MLWSALLRVAVAVPGEAGPELGHLCPGTMPRGGTAGPEQEAAVRRGGNGHLGQGPQAEHLQRHGAALPYL